jgi:hypothetical protein
MCQWHAHRHTDLFVDEMDGHNAMLGLIAEQVWNSRNRGGRGFESEGSGIHGAIRPAATDFDQSQ